MPNPFDFDSPVEVSTAEQTQNFVDLFRASESSVLILTPILHRPSGPSLVLGTDRSLRVGIFPDDRGILAPLAPLFEKAGIPKIGIDLAQNYELIRNRLGIALAGMSDLAIADRLLSAGFETDHSEQAILGRYGHQCAGETPVQWVQALWGAFNAIMIDSIPRSKLQKVWSIERNAQPAFCEMAYQGQRINRPAWIQLMRKNLNAAEEAKNELLEFFSPICAKNDEGRPIINLDSPVQVLEAFREMKVQLPSTEKSVLLAHAHLPPIRSLLNYRSANHGFERYGHTFLEAADHNDRIHFQVHQNGTASGRPAAFGGLNGLNIPKKGGYREALIPGEGSVLSQADYNAIELRILAQGSGDPLMLEVFNRGHDYHQWFASDMLQRQVYRNSKERHGIKRVAYGLPYGQSIRGIHEALCEEGYDGTLQETERLFKGYVARVPRLIAFLRAVGDLAVKERKITNSNGRLRYWPEPSPGQDIQQWEASVRRSAASFPGQSTNADFIKIAIARIWDEILTRGWLGKVWMSSMKYDDLTLETPKELAAEVKALQWKHMTEAAQEMLPLVPVVLEGGIRAC